MDMPTHSGTYLAILILRTVGCTQDKVVTALGCWKQTVGDVQRWFQKISYNEAKTFVKDNAIREVVQRQFASNEMVEKEWLEASLLTTGDAILRHFRPDYMEMEQESETKRKSVPPKYWEEHNERLRNLAKEFVGSFYKPPPSLLRVAGLQYGQHVRLVGERWTRWWKYVLKEGQPILISPVQESEPFLWECLQSHLLAEFPTLKCELAEWGKAAVSIVTRCRGLIGAIMGDVDFLPTWGKEGLSRDFAYTIYEIALTHFSEKSFVPAFRRQDEHGLTVLWCQGRAIALGTSAALDAAEELFRKLIEVNVRESQVGEIIDLYEKMDSKTKPIQEKLQLVVYRGTFEHGDCPMCRGWSRS